jgi:hypothetical protein
MYIDLALSAPRISALLELQAATALFDDIASRPGQGRVSEVGVPAAASSSLRTACVCQLPLPLLSAEGCKTSCAECHLVRLQAARGSGFK